MRKASIMEMKSIAYYSVSPGWKLNTLNNGGGKNDSIKRNI